MGFIVFLIIGLIVLLFIGGYYILIGLDEIRMEIKRTRREIEHERDRCYSSCCDTDKF